MIEKVVYIQGAWDLLHVGHFNILYRADKIASRLIVGVDSDESIKKQKGHLPILPLLHRIEALGACTCVDEVIKSESMLIDAALLQSLGVEILILDGDKLCMELPGRKEAIDAGIEVRYLPYTKGISTTKIRNLIRKAK